MKTCKCIIAAAVFGLLLTGCSDHRPTKRGGDRYTKLVGKNPSNQLYESIAMSYWSDSSDNPVAVVISFASSGHLPDLDLIKCEDNFTDGQCTYIKLNDVAGGRNIPLFEKELVSSGRVPVYYAIDKRQVTKTSLTFDEFTSLRTAVDNKNFAQAKAIVTK